MIPLDLLEACSQMHRADRECWRALKKLAPRARVLLCMGPAERRRAKKNVRKGVQRALKRLETAYHHFLAALAGSSAADEERSWHCRDLRHRHAIQCNFVRATFRIDPPILPFEEIEVDYRRREAQHAESSARSTPQAGAMRIAAVWGRIEQDWLLRDWRTRANIDWLRQLLAEQQGWRGEEDWDHGQTSRQDGYQRRHHLS